MPHVCCQPLARLGKESPAGKGARTGIGFRDGKFGPKVSIAVNWGVAALVYLIVGGLIARLIARAAPRPAVPTAA